MDRRFDLTLLSLAAHDTEQIASLLCEHGGCVREPLPRQEPGLVRVGSGAGLASIELHSSPWETVATRLVSLLLADPEHPTGRAPVVLPGGLAVGFGMHELADLDTPAGTLVGLTIRSTDPTVAAAAWVHRFAATPISAHRDVAIVALGSCLLTLVREKIPDGIPMFRELVLVGGEADGPAHRERGPDGMPLLIRAAGSEARAASTRGLSRS